MGRRKRKPCAYCPQGITTSTQFYPIKLSSGGNKLGMNTLLLTNPSKPLVNHVFVCHRHFKMNLRLQKDASKKRENSHICIQTPAKRSKNVETDDEDSLTFEEESEKVNPETSVDDTVRPIRSSSIKTNISKYDQWLHSDDENPSNQQNNSSSNEPSSLPFYTSPFTTYPMLPTFSTLQQFTQYHMQSYAQYQSPKPNLKRPIPLRVTMGKPLHILDAQASN